MIRRPTGPRAALLALAALVPMTAACGSSSPAGPSDPAPSDPVTATVAGAYTLTIVPDPACGLPVGPHGISMEVVATAAAGHTGIRGTLPGGDPTLTLELVYDTPGHLHGSVGTQTEVVFPTGLYVFIRGIADGNVSVSASGRGEVADGPLIGEVEMSTDDAILGDCTSASHRWSLRTR